ncbi:MAG: hypothetical protein OEL87_00295 [Nanoarchaeota archaeon]|nr:hypothetical protein [Nanoarchaeota archaeon]
MEKIKCRLVDLATGHSSEVVELRRAAVKVASEYKPKEMNLDTIQSNIRQNPSGNIYIAEILYQERQGEMAKNPRPFRKESVNIFE